MFDCVMPTRNARNGRLFTRFGDIKIKNARTRTTRARSTKPATATPAAISQRAYLHHLHRIGEILGAHAQHHPQPALLPDVLMRELREAIAAGTLRDCRTLPCRAQRAGQSDTIARLFSTAIIRPLFLPRRLMC
jgi:queuine tRNA-ribosyltransferase